MRLNVTTVKVLHSTASLLRYIAEIVNSVGCRIPIKCDKCERSAFKEINGHVFCSECWFSVSDDIDTVIRNFLKEK